MSGLFDSQSKIIKNNSQVKEDDDQSSRVNFDIDKSKFNNLK